MINWAGDIVAIGVGGNNCTFNTAFLTRAALTTFPTITSATTTAAAATAFALRVVFASLNGPCFQGGLGCLRLARFLCLARIGSFGFLISRFLVFLLTRFAILFAFFARTPALTVPALATLTVTITVTALAVFSAVASTARIGVVTGATFAATFFLVTISSLRRNWLRCCSRLGCKQAFDTLPKRRGDNGAGSGLGCHAFSTRRGFWCVWGRLIGRNAFHNRLGTHRLGLGRCARLGDRIINRLVHQLVTWHGDVEFFRIVAQALDLIIGRFQMHIGNQQHIHLEAHFDGVNILTFFIQQECGDINRHLCMNCSGVFFHRLFLNDAQDMQCGRRGAANMADTMATRTGDVT